MLTRYLLSAGSRFAGALLQALFFILLTRLMQPSDLGVFSASVAALAVIYGITDYGMATRFLRLGSDVNAVGYRYWSIVARAVAIVIVVIAVVAISLYVRDKVTVILIISAVLLATGESFGELSIAGWQGIQRSGIAASALLLRRGLAVVPIILAISPLGWIEAVDGIFVGCMISAVCGLCTYVAIVLPLRRVPRLDLRTVLRSNMSFALASAGPQVAQLDSVAIASVAGSAMAGLYAPAARIMNPINIGILSFVQVIVPELARIDDITLRLRVFKRARRWVLLFATLVAAGAPIAPWLTVGMFGSAYVESAPVVAAVIVGAALSGVAQFHLAWFYGTSLPASVPVIMIFGSATGVAMMALLGLAAGTAGIAVAFAGMHLIVTGGIVAMWHREVRGGRST